ncbi:MAG: PKD domain-containing protein [Cytophagaceae bacterium]|nr:MAG: PKD domain-containing protein [Cytophagaceae bacterium]
MGLSSSSVANPVASPTYNGVLLDTTYTYFVTASLGACSSLDSVKVRVKKQPAVTVTPTVAAICLGTNTTLTAAGADTYSWTPATGLNSSNTAIVIANPTSTTTYQVTGSYANGCRDTRSVVVTVNSHARAMFTASATTLCAPINLNTVITGQSFPVNSSYTWYADDVLVGTNSTGIFPSFPMTLQGDTIIIKLVAQSAAGCKADSMQMTFITRPGINADFIKDLGDGCSPLAINFTNTTPVYSNNQYSWNFGNGTTSTLAVPPVVTYLASTNYRDTTYYITLSVNNGCGPTIHRDSVKVYPQSQARFNVNNPSGCSPFTSIFTNTSRGNNTAYYWDFGDGTRDTTYANGTLSHIYTTGIIRAYTVELIAENRCERDTQTLNILVSPNSISVQLQANGNQLAGCAPHTVVFNNTSVGAAQLTWDFDDGTPNITTPNDQTTVTHTFQNTGVYIVKIRLQNNCSDTIVERRIEVLPKPTAAFTPDVSVACPSTVINFTNQSQNATGYKWIWGDGQESTVVAGQHAWGIPGNYEVKLVAYRSHPSGTTCTDTARRNIIIRDKIDAVISATTNKPCAPFAYSATAGSASCCDMIAARDTGSPRCSPRRVARCCRRTAWTPTIQPRSC